MQARFSRRSRVSGEGSPKASGFRFASASSGEGIDSASGLGRASTLAARRTIVEINFMFA